MGFGYEKRGRERIISERPEIIAWRERYLRRIRKIREADPERAIVYTDETWLNQSHRPQKEWVDVETLKEKNLRSLRLSGLTIGCTKEMTGKGRRLIISDAMTESGPKKKEDTVDGGENDSEIAEGILFEEDYHDSMDGESYKCFFLKSQYVKICRNTRLSWLIMHLTIKKIRKITPLASGESNNLNNLLICLQKRT